MKLTVLGAGAWGTALAASAAPRHAVHLWARDATQALQMQATRHNLRYLPEVALPAALQIGADFDAALAHAAGGLVIIATPMAALAEMLERARAEEAGILWLCKGFEPGGRLGHEIAQTLCPAARTGVLSGPSFAVEVARGQPTALVAASHDASLCEQAVAALHGDSLRAYTSSDPIGAGGDTGTGTPDQRPRLPFRDLIEVGDVGGAEPGLARGLGAGAGRASRLGAGRL